ncbi:Copia protein [Senna tora]|uniref:Copia protein n=1 Tax=Senna tora TaxID=362788 RepID=A0A834WNC0_9FABA|nr:Copia protein [Senna tora]
MNRRSNSEIGGGETCVIPFIINTDAEKNEMKQRDSVRNKSGSTSSSNSLNTQDDSSSSTARKCDVVQDQSSRDSSESRGSSESNPHSRDHLNQSRDSLLNGPETVLGPTTQAAPEVQREGTHQMVTRAKAGIHKPRYPFVGLLKGEDPFSSFSSSLNIEPKSVAEALSSPQWRRAMVEEFSALQKNKTWELVPFTGNDTTFLKTFIKRLNDVFALKDLGPLYYFLGLEVYRDRSGFHLSQAKYVLDILKKFNMLTCAPAPTPMAIVTTRPDIAFSVNKLSQFLANPTEVHFQGVKRILSCPYVYIL